LLLVVYLFSHAGKMLAKYLSRQKVDRLTMYSQLFFLCEKLMKLVRDGNFYR